MEIPLTEKAASAAFSVYARKSIEVGTFFVPMFQLLSAPDRRILHCSQPALTRFKHPGLQYEILLVDFDLESRQPERHHQLCQPEIRCAHSSESFRAHY